MSYENSGWATFGKVTAWLAGIAAAGGLVYFVGSEIYKAGENSARAESEQEMAKQKRDLEQDAWEQEDQTRRKIDALNNEGRLLPENICLRYRYNPNTKTAILVCDGQLDLRLGLDGNHSSIEALALEYAGVNYRINGNGQITNLARRVDASYIPIRDLPQGM